MAQRRTLQAEPAPRLVDGDRLDRATFHARYEARPDIRRAELIEGVVRVASPARFSFHEEQASLMGWWLQSYQVFHPGLKVAGSPTIYLDDRNEVQPDALLFDPTSGRCRIRDDGYLEGAPELVIEVTASRAAYDLGPKMEAYRRNGVEEYVVWRVEDNAIDWFRLETGTYGRLEPDSDGVVRSRWFEGLSLDVPAMLRGDKRAVLAALGAGLAG